MKDTLIVLVIVGMAIGCFVMFQINLHNQSQIDASQNQLQQQFEQHDRRLRKVEVDANRTNQIFHGMLDALPDRPFPTSQPMNTRED